MNKKTLVIVGGGAAGFFAAANLDASKYEIIILEQGFDVLQKVKISGGGRCNVTNATFDPRDLVKKYPRGEKELRSVFAKFQPADTMDWYISRGVDLKIEEDGRIFPESNSSQSIINCLLQEVDKRNVSIQTKTVVKEIAKTNEGYILETSKGQIAANIVVFTPGSSQKTLKIIENLGHSLVPSFPSLFTFNIKDPILESLPGTSFTDVEVSIPSIPVKEYGPLLITHWGLSGPAILKLSAWKAIELAKMDYRFSLEVNFISTSTSEAIELVKQYKQDNPKKSIGQAKIFPITSRFWLKVLETLSVDSSKQMANLSKAEITNICKTLTSKSLSVHGKSTYKDEFVTAGGVSLKEIDFKNMTSKLLDDFYLAGEVLNIDAITGGFNFQACWSEAWLIAQHLNSQ